MWRYFLLLCKKELMDTRQSQSLHDPQNSDLQVEARSAALSSWTVDVVVSGSIGAVESVRFIRALRRLGAVVTPWLTQGGAQFITPTALSWAAGTEVRQGFAGDASHIALADACIVAPASASLIGKVAHGITDTAAAALVTSYLGGKRPVLLLPNMHDSLALAPAVQDNVERLRGAGVHILEARSEEGKRKFPDPAQLADEVAHLLNAAAWRQRGGAPGVLVTMGSTRGYIDDVRYISNYSSGALGTAIAEELYRFGFPTHVVAGPCQIRPQSYTTLAAPMTNDDMEAAALRAVAAGASAAVLAASVLDFAPENKTSGKISTAQNATLAVPLVRTRKIIAAVHPASGIKVGFKLETGLDAAKAQAIAQDYMPRYGLSMLVVNDLADVDGARHQATVFTATHGSHSPGAPVPVVGKRALAQRIAEHVRQRLTHAAS